jgi:hypothetical protein
MEMMRLLNIGLFAKLIMLVFLSGEREWNALINLYT